MEENITQKENLIFKRFSLRKFQEMVVAGEKLTKYCNLRNKSILGIILF